MRILLANNHLARRGGTEMWIKTMAEHLHPFHTVHIFTYGPNNIANYIPDYSEDIHYDLALINHNTCLEDLRDRPNIGTKVFTSHGVIPQLEKAIEGADFYVGVSEETADAIPYPATVIRNPINCVTFSPYSEVSSSLENVLFMSTHQGKALNVIKEATKQYNLSVFGRAVTSSDPAGEMNNADLVFGLGRTAYEAMACNRNVIIFDYKGGDGFVTPDNIHEFNKHNCSGRSQRRWFDAQDVRELLDMYDPNIKMRDYVLENHEASMIARKYLEFVD